MMKQNKTPNKITQNYTVYCVIQELLPSNVTVAHEAVVHVKSL